MGGRVGQDMDGVGDAHANEAKSLSGNTWAMGVVGDGVVLGVNHMRWYRFRARVNNIRCIV